jgi:hypothetical protein
MGKKIRPYLFVYDRKFLETNSLLDLRTTISDSDWNLIAEHTIDFYAQLKALSKCKIGALKLDKSDVKIMRSLKHTIDFMISLNTKTITKKDLDDKITLYSATIKEEVKNSSTVKIAFDNKTDADIVVTRLDEEDNNGSL